MPTCGVTDEDSDDYLDPELDPVPEAGGSIPGPFSLSQLVVGIHLLAALALLPFVWSAYTSGNTPLVVSLGLLMAMLAVAGVAAGRVTARRFGPE